MLDDVINGVLVDVGGTQHGNRSHEAFSSSKMDDCQCHCIIEQNNYSNKKKTIAGAQLQDL